MLATSKKSGPSTLRHGPNSSSGRSRHEVPVPKTHIIPASTRRCAYELLERLAKKAGDEQTAEVARKNRAEEQAMARKIHSNWDRFLDLTLATPGVLAE